MPRDDPVRSRVEMWAFTNPLRFRLFELLRDGPATASQLARRLGESSGTTSYHLRMLARVGAIDEDWSLGTRRERWWRRPERAVLAPTDPDPEGRAITDRLFALFFQRDEEARHRFVTGEMTDEWHRAAFVGSWFVELTPDEAAELGTRLLEVVDEYRGRAAPSADRTLVSVSVLPWLDTGDGT
jgi:DNA-binding transcriptional ArsR family regulator